MSRHRMPTSDDWRRQGQEKYLKGVKLMFRDYHPYRIGWDHDHCEFCGAKFSLNEGDLKKGYSTEDGYHWICSRCFNDFKNEFCWQVEEQNEIAHKLKRDFLGNKAKISQFDLYKDTKTGEILILQKGGKGTPIQTGEFIK